MKSQNHWNFYNFIKLLSRIVIVRELLDGKEESLKQSEKNAAKSVSNQTFPNIQHLGENGGGKKHTKILFIVLFNFPPSAQLFSTKSHSELCWGLLPFCCKYFFLSLLAGSSCSFLILPILCGFTAAKFSFFLLCVLFFVVKKSKASDSTSIGRRMNSRVHKQR